MRIATEVTSMPGARVGSKRVYSARVEREGLPSTAPVHPVCGSGASAKEAEENLAQALVWMTHCAPAVVRVPSTGDLWLIAPCDVRLWSARKIRPEGGFGCITTFGRGKSQRAALEEFLAGYEPEGGA